MKTFAFPVVALALAAGAWGDDVWAGGRDAGVRIVISIATPQHQGHRGQFHPRPHPGYVLVPGPAVIHSPPRGVHLSPHDTIRPGAAFRHDVVSPPPFRIHPRGVSRDGPGIRFFCPDFRLFFPDVRQCPSPWLRVLD
ncbi:MAG: hypothetical protein HYU77_09245 [Betaproteobacteria bacterium]|nr:hypothetical protein [Betaproteobacteria bacterium]